MTLRRPYLSRSVLQGIELIVTRSGLVTEQQLSLLAQPDRARVFGASPDEVARMKRAHAYLTSLVAWGRARRKRMRAGTRSASSSDPVECGPGSEVRDVRTN